MKFRQSVPADAQAIAELHTASWRNTYSSVLSEAYLNQIVPSERRQLWQERLITPKRNQFVIVAEEQECIVGFACGFAKNHEAWGSYLDNLHVDAAHQGKGIGRALLTEIAQWCETQSAGKGLYLSVNQANVRAQRFYLGLGGCNAEPGVWNAPDGSKVPTYWFTWKSVVSLAQLSNP